MNSCYVGSTQAFCRHCFIYTTILWRRYNYPYFAGEETDSEGLNDLPKTILPLGQKSPWEQATLASRLVALFSQYATTQGSLECWEGSKSLAVSKMFILLSSCLCKGFQSIPAPQGFTPGRKEFVIVNNYLFLLTFFVLLPSLPLKDQKSLPKVSSSFRWQ